MDKDELLAQFPFPRVIDNTMYEQWKACPHSFFRRTIQGLQLAELGEPGTPPTIRKGIHTHFGSCLAKALEVTRREYHEGAGHGEALAAGAQALIAKWDADGPIPSPRTRTEEAKTLDACVLAHAGYFREWDLDDPMQQIMVIDDRPLIELSGARDIPGSSHPVTGEPILYAGRFDAVLDRFGTAIGLDDKTTGASVEGEAWQNNWTLRGQFTGYVWLANSWGYQMEQFLVHGVQVLKTTCKYAECLEVRPWWMVESWLRQLKDDLGMMCLQYNEFIERLVGNPDRGGEASGGEAALDLSLDLAHPFGQRFGDACHHYNQRCQFTRLCSEPNPQDFLDAYIVERWDPLKQAEED